MSAYVVTDPADVKPGDYVIHNVHLRLVVTDVTESRHGLAAAYGAVVIHGVSYVTGRPLPALTLMPGQTVVVVPELRDGTVTA